MTRTIRKRSQPRLDEPRLSLPSCVEKHIMAEVNKTAKKFGVSRSWVIAEALADTFGVELQPFERYEKTIKLVKKVS